MKRLRFYLLGLVLVFMFGLVACKSNSKLDQLRKEGYVITVRYEANGGKYINRAGVTIIDMINPTDYEQDSSGMVHIKLDEPTDSKRPQSGNEPIIVTRSDYFLVGWYTNKTIRTNSDGKVVNENGDALVEINGKYYLDSNNEEVSEPAYDYSGYWDFNTSTIDYKIGSGEYELTLYAVWSTFFEFNYYYQVNGVWTKLNNVTKFNYVTTNREGSNTFDKDTIWVPTWNDGAMVYSCKYNDNNQYDFPKVDGMTFNSAYEDMECSKEITSSFEHKGTIDYATGKAVNKVQNIYVKYDQGEMYRITEARQLVNNANLNGIYEIQADLDFTGLNWPTLFDVGVFNGKIYTKDNANYTFSNINVKHSSASAKNGGLFGNISKDATISNITFENVTLDLVSTGTNKNKGLNIGLFAGNIDKDATLTNVKVSGTIKIGNVTLSDEYLINLVTNSNSEKVTTDGVIHVVIYGTASGTEYRYTVDPENVVIDENGSITLISKAALKLPNESYEIQ